MEKAGFFERFIALIVDNIMIAVIAGVLGCCVWFPLSLLGGNDENLMGALIGLAAFLVWVVILFMQFVYFGYFWGKDGQSLGMKLVNIKVIHRDSDQISFLRGGLRGTFGYWVSSLIFGLGFLWAAFDAEKETWHDKIFDTWVVKT
jgi:uncharacterized RDD family membrane protein YckC